MTSVDLEALLTEHAQARIDRGELVAKPRAIPRCPGCQVPLVGPDAPSILCDGNGGDYQCEACKVRLPRWVPENVSEYHGTGGLQRPRGRPKRVKRPKQMVVLLEDEKLQAFKALCKERGISMNDAVRAFVERFLDGAES